MQPLLAVLALLPVIVSHAQQLLGPVSPAMLDPSSIPRAEFALHAHQICGVMLETPLLVCLVMAASPALPPQEVASLVLPESIYMERLARIAISTLGAQMDRLLAKPALVATLAIQLQDHA